MFKHSAGEDLIDQLNFMADEGFTAFEDNNLKKISMDKFFLHNRYICVSKPKPAKLFNSRKVSFYYVKNLGLVEILEKNEVY